MALNERQNEILRVLKEEKKASVSLLSKRFYVSEATVRRDLMEMKNMGLVERNHGGAYLPENSEEISIFLRMSRNAVEKERVVTKALPHIPPFKSVFIDSSSTALALAERMDFHHKTVVTNNLQTAMQLSKKPDVTLIMLGGMVQYNTISATGSWTARQLKDFSFDLCIFSCASVFNGEVYERSLDTRDIKQAAFTQAQKRILLIDHTKFKAHGTYRLMGLEEYDYVFTDTTPPENLMDKGINFIY